MSAVVLENPFDVLEEVQDERTTNNLVRKAKKKLKEIELLKKRDSLTPEETAKVLMENYWKWLIPERQRYILKNKWSILSTCGEIKDDILKKKNECPICYDEIPENMIVVSNCNHIYCARCTKNMIKCKILTCCLCREEIWDYHFNDEDVRIELTNLMHSLTRYL
jgi:hypothetical protein